MDDRVERMGLNEALFREVNERVRAVNVGFSGGVTEAEFVCECADESCLERMRMTLLEYEHVRADPTQFAVQHGHLVPTIEVVVEEHESYIVVAKRHDDAARVAVETDPRE
jgi:hypothetical protein